MENAQNLAPSEVPADLRDPAQQYFTFLVNGEEYGVDILNIQEVKVWTGARQVPNLPAYIKGVMDLRGDVVPIIDLREFFGVRQQAYDNTTVVVFLRSHDVKDNKTLGLVVDAVSEVYELRASDLRPVPDLGLNQSILVKSLANVGENMVSLLNVDELLGDNLANYACEPVYEAEHKSGGKDTGTAAHEAIGEEAQDYALIERSFQALAPKAELLVARFYRRLFERFPEVKPLFSNTRQEDQEKKLLSALKLVVENIRRPEVLTPALQQLGEKHQGYGALPAHYDAVAETLLEVLGDFGGDLWTDQVSAAWSRALTAIKGVMLAAYKPDINNLEADILEQSFKALAPQAEKMVSRFYERLFEQYPAVIPMFAGSTVADQTRKLVSALQLVVNNVRRPSTLTSALEGLGRKHQGYGAEPAHYDAVAKTLLEVLGDYAGDAWTPETRKAWANALTVIKETMLGAYEDGLSERQITNLENSFNILAPRADELVARFYGTLFRLYPQVKPLFANANPKEQKQKLIAALKLVIGNLRNERKLKGALQQLGRKHQAYGALEAHYDAVAETLVTIMGNMAGPAWNNELQQTWMMALMAVKELMLSGYDK